MRGDDVVRGQDQHSRALGQHEALAVDVNGLGCERRVFPRPVALPTLIVAFMLAKPWTSSGRRAVDAAGEDEVAVAVADHAGAQTDGVVAGGAGALGRRRVGEAEQHAGLAGRDVAAEVGQEERADAVRAVGGERRDGGAVGVVAVKRRADQARGAGRRLGGQLQARVAQGVPAHRDGEEDEAGVPLVDVLGEAKSSSSGFQSGDLADDVAGAVDLAARDAAEAGLPRQRRDRRIAAKAAPGGSPRRSRSRSLDGWSGLSWRTPRPPSLRQAPEHQAGAGPPPKPRRVLQHVFPGAARARASDTQSSDPIRRVVDRRRQGDAVAHPLGAASIVSRGRSKRRMAWPVSD